MKKKQLYKMNFEEAVCKLSEENNYIISIDTLKDFAIEKLKEDNVGYALHILEAIYNSNGEWFEYDFCMGTLENPTSLETIEDLEKFCT